MAIRIGSVVLTELVIENEFGWAGIDVRSNKSLDGTPIVWEQSATGQPMDLVGDTDTAWLSRSTLSSLQALAAVPNATYTLIYQSRSYNVRFRHEDAPVISAEAIIPRPNHGNTDWYNRVRIRLMIVTTISTTTTTSSTTSSTSTSSTSSSSSSTSSTV